MWWQRSLLHAAPDKVCRWAHDHLLQVLWLWASVEGWVTTFFHFLSVWGQLADPYYLPQVLWIGRRMGVDAPPFLFVWSQLTNSQPSPISAVKEWKDGCWFSSISCLRGISWQTHKHHPQVLWICGRMGVDALPFAVCVTSADKHHDFPSRAVKQWKDGCWCSSISCLCDIRWQTHNHLPQVLLLPNKWKDGCGCSFSFVCVTSADEPMITVDCDSTSAVYWWKDECWHLHACPYSVNVMSADKPVTNSANLAN